MSGFQLGRVLATPGAIALCEEHGINMAELLRRHVRGDWGDIDPGDRGANEAALKHGSRILSVYGEGEQKLWIITDAETDACPACVAGIGVCQPGKGEWHGNLHFRTDQPPRRLSTTVMLPSDY